MSEGGSVGNGGKGVKLKAIAACVYRHQDILKTMPTTTVFKSGNSLALRLPKGFELPLGRVEIRREGAAIVIEPAGNGWPVNLTEIFPFDPELKDWQREPQPEAPKGKEW
jgi:virulence-associated protein VagC